MPRITEPRTGWTALPQNPNTPWATLADGCRQTSWWAFTDGTNFSDGTAWTDGPYPQQDDTVASGA